MTRYGSRFSRRVSALFISLIMGGLLLACTPTVQVAAPKEPITVNLNVKIQHEIYIKVDKDVDKLFSEKGLF